ncbi:MAG: serine hydrolase domain-containing protein [Vicinamibacterales bacterium]
MRAGAATLIDRALADGVASAATAEVGRSAGPVWTHAAGHLAATRGAPRAAADTVFDLASLTKVLATTAIARELAGAGRLDLDAPVASLIPGWSGADRRAVTVADLLAHASGLPAHRPYYLTLRARPAFEGAICVEPLDYAPRSASVYSDLGFMLLGFVLEDAGGAPLDRQFDAWRARTIGEDREVRYGCPDAWRPRTAATEDDPWRARLLTGEVHDENAWALGGVAAHAGLFGTAAATGLAARWWLELARRPDPLTERFLRRSLVPGSSRALGWDTMLPTSSCGTRLSPAAIGHTGFTGTSVWIDPEQDLYVVLLTNRVHPTRAGEGIQALRRAFHDAVVADLAV